MNEITNINVQEYIRGLLPAREELLTRLELQAEQDIVPIIQPEVGQLLKFLVQTYQVKRVLEIGTAIGYSTIWLARAVGRDGQVVTIDSNRKRTAEAKENFKTAGITDSVTLIEQDALVALKQLTGGFDLIFLDAMKSAYPDFFALCWPLLRAGGLIVADNVLLKGMVADESLVTQRHRRMVGKLREYLQIVTTHKELETTVLPIGDGVAISYRRG